MIRRLRWLSFVRRIAKCLPSNWTNAKCVGGWVSPGTFRNRNESCMWRRFASVDFVVVGLVRKKTTSVRYIAAAFYFASATSGTKIPTKPIGVCLGNASRMGKKQKLWSFCHVTHHSLAVFVMLHGTTLMVVVQLFQSRTKSWHGIDTLSQSRFRVLQCLFFTMLRGVFPTSPDKYVDCNTFPPLFYFIPRLGSSQLNDTARHHDK